MPALHRIWLVVVLALALASSVLLAPAAAANTANADTYRLLDRFGKALERIRSSHIKEPDHGKLIKAAIEGMIKADPGNSELASIRKILQSESRDNLYGSLSLFGDAFQILHSKSKLQDADRKLIEAATAAMVASLNDGSRFFTESALRNMLEDRPEQYGGLGIEVTMENAVVKVIATMKDSPADRAGMKANDLITHVNSNQVVGLTLNEAVAKMRGTAGEPLTLTILRRGREGPFNVTLVRQRIQTNSVKWRIVKNTGYIKLLAFNSLTETHLAEALLEIANQSGSVLKGFIVDLRFNAGSSPDTATALGNLFLTDGMIALARGRDASSVKRRLAHDGDLARGKPLIVLVNKHTSAGAEVLAGALQDHKRARIMGSNTAGNGLLQSSFTLKGLGTIRLATEEYLRPSGARIEGRGIDPDIVVAEPDAVKIGSDTDTLLAAAIAELHNVPETASDTDKVAETASPPPQQPAIEEKPREGVSAVPPVRLGRRVALVIGNSDYRNTAKLRNPARDSADTTAALTRLGFDVTHLKDLTRQGMHDAFRQFARVVRGADAAVFYYAGHAMQFNGVNYLMPVDAQLKDEADVPYELAKLENIINDLGRMNGVRIAILDSCRDNPLENRLKQSIANTRSTARTRGFAPVGRNDGLIIAYSTQPGSVADDGDGHNSPFTSALLQHIETPGLEFGRMFRRVMRSVRKATNGAQRPELSISFDGEFFFRPTATNP